MKAKFSLYITTNVVDKTTIVMDKSETKLSQLEMQVLRAFWDSEELSVREAHESMRESGGRPEYTTFQTVVGRLESKGALERVRKIGNAWLYRAAVSKKSVVSKLVDDIVGLLDGAASPIVSHLMESGKLSKEDLESLERVAKEGENVEKSTE